MFALETWASLADLRQTLSCASEYEADARTQAAKAVALPEELRGVLVSDAGVTIAHNIESATLLPGHLLSDNPALVWFVLTIVPSPLRIYSGAEEAIINAAIATASIPLLRYCKDAVADEPGVRTTPWACNFQGGLRSTAASKSVSMFEHMMPELKTLLRKRVQEVGIDHVVAYTVHVAMMAPTVAMATYTLRLLVQSNIVQHVVAWSYSYTLLTPLLRVSNTVCVRWDDSEPVSVGPISASVCAACFVWHLDSQMPPAPIARGRSPLIAALIYRDHNIGWPLRYLFWSHQQSGTELSPYAAIFVSTTLLRGSLLYGMVGDTGDSIVCQLANELVAEDIQAQLPNLVSLVAKAAARNPEAAMGWMCGMTSDDDQAGSDTAAVRRQVSLCITSPFTADQIMSNSRLDPGRPTYGEEADLSPAMLEAVVPALREVWANEAVTSGPDPEHVVGQHKAVLNVRGTYLPAATRLLSTQLTAAIHNRRSAVVIAIARDAGFPRWSDFPDTFSRRQLEEAARASADAHELGLALLDMGMPAPYSAVAEALRNGHTQWAAALGADAEAEMRATDRKIDPMQRQVLREAKRVDRFVGYFKSK